MTHSLPDDAIARGAADALDAADVGALCARVATYFAGKERALRRRYETVVSGEDGDVLLADTDFWARTGDALGFTDAETAAVRRAHEATLRLAGVETDRGAEFASALEIRTAVVLG